MSTGFRASEDADTSLILVANKIANKRAPHVYFILQIKVIAEKELELNHGPTGLFYIERKFGFGCFDYACGF